MIYKLLTIFILFPTTLFAQNNAKTWVTFHVYSEYNYFDKFGAGIGIEHEKYNASVFIQSYEGDVYKGINGSMELVQNGYVTPLLGYKIGIKGKNELIADPYVSFRFFDAGNFTPEIYALPITLFSSIHLGFKLRYRF